MKNFFIFIFILVSLSGCYLKKFVSNISFINDKVVIDPSKSRYYVMAGTKKLI